MSHHELVTVRCAEKLEKLPQRNVTWFVQGLNYLSFENTRLKKFLDIFSAEFGDKLEKVENTGTRRRDFLFLKDLLIKIFDQKFVYVFVSSVFTRHKKIYFPFPTRDQCDHFVIIQFQFFSHSSPYPVIPLVAVKSSIIPTFEHPHSPLMPSSFVEKNINRKETKGVDE